MSNPSWRLSAFEYRLALALGATVGVVAGSGGSADALLKDPLWADVAGLPLFPLPPDAKTLRAFVSHDGVSFDPTVLDTMAQEFHDCLVAWSNEEVLTAAIKEYDRVAVRAFPAILARAGMEVYRAQ